MIEAVGRGAADQTWRVVVLACCLTGLIAIFGTMTVVHFTVTQPEKAALVTMPVVLNRAEIMCARFGGQPKVRDVIARTKNGVKLLDLHVSCRGDLTFIIHTIEDNRP